ncbi:MAG TPA: nucleotide exchange factor GrpE [Candidatus Nitrosotenuis sp.]|nr:nucleotide exchange factor GrpE [Candidatus Nitrosotenuis sp.]
MSEQNETAESKEIQISEEAAPQNEKLIEELKQNLASCEDKLKRSLADFINLERKTKTDIENGVTEKIDKFMLKFLTIYDDLTRAAQVLKKENPNAAGLDSILKNIDALLAEYGITPIEALGEIFDPNLHEAVSIVEDEGLDDNTITKEIRKGYISHKRTLRPTLVEISKKPQSK